jgi:dihydrofolate synthase/folylpolyglutamate synthase
LSDPLDLPLDAHDDFPYYSTVDQIYHAEWSIPKLARLELMRRSIRALWPKGHPTRLIHVAGTAGKGSTSRLLETGLGALGHTGSFMSPHLFDYRERFSIDGRFVERALVQRTWVERIQPYCLQLALDQPTHVHSFHEVSILLALAIFEQADVAWAAMETGVGGRYDQTRALEMHAAVLTNVGNDHAHLLGPTLWQRALDKAGIARAAVPFFTTERNPESLEVIRQVCADAGAPLTVVDEAAVDALAAALHAPGQPPLHTQALLTADHQHWNAALALATIRGICPELAADDVLGRLRQAELLGRFWRVEEGVYADIAHNMEKIRVLVAELAAKFPTRDKILVLGISGQRQAVEVFAELAYVAKAVIVTTASYKGQDPAAVRAALEPLLDGTLLVVIDDPGEALATAKAMRADDDVILLTGSTYMIEQALNPDPHMRHLHATFGWRNRG